MLKFNFLLNPLFQWILEILSQEINYKCKIKPFLKEVFRNASVLLYNATHRRAYFEDIKILIPSTWEKDSYLGKEVERAFDTWEYSTADIRINEPDLVFQEPKVFQSSQCGQPGDYMIIGKDFFLQPEKYEMLGSLGTEIITYLHANGIS